MIKVIRHKINNPKDLLKKEMIEIDIRDKDGRMVLSHDSPEDLELYWDLKGFLKEAEKKDIKLIAVNIKSDGLEQETIDALENSGIDYFVFDMSRPSYHRYQQLTDKIALPLSNYDTVAGLSHYPPAKWVWIDCFNKNFEAQVKQYKKAREAYPDINICMIAPDLWGVREANIFFDELKENDDDKLYVCTDYPGDFE